MSILLHLNSYRQYCKTQSRGRRAGVSRRVPVSPGTIGRGPTRRQIGFTAATMEPLIKYIFCIIYKLNWKWRSMTRYKMQRGDDSLTKRGDLICSRIMAASATKTCRQRAAAAAGPRAVDQSISAVRACPRQPSSPGAAGAAGLQLSR